jgi:hypothetical protein
MSKADNSKNLRRVGIVLLTLGVTASLLGGALLLPEMHILSQPEPCYAQLPVAGEEREQVKDAVEVSRITAFPIGLECTWVWSGRAIERQFYWDWSLNTLLFGGGLFVIAGVSQLLYSARRQRQVLIPHPAIDDRPDGSLHSR